MWGKSSIEIFEKGYQETLKYKKQYGNANAPRCYKTPDGYALASWQQNQRTNYKIGKLEKERVNRLEEIDFEWGKSSVEIFEKGYQETLKYKKQYGNANAPSSYKTPDGYALAGWQTKQRTNYKMGKLAKERVSKLENIGFIWKLR